MEVVLKGLALVEPVEDSDEHPNGAFRLILSDPSEDREREIVDPFALEPLPDHIAMDIDHGMSVATTVGSGAPSYDAGGRLVVEGTYASTELGQMTRALVNEGHVRTASVAFIAKKTKKIDGVQHVQKGELLNGAFTPVPVNPRAKVLLSKAVKAAAAELKAGARNSKSDASMIQAIHDHASSLGADCSAMKSLKSIVGSVEAQQDRVRDALEDEYGEYCCWLRGVLPDTIVFDRNGDTFQQSYTDDGAVVTLEGDPTEVDIHEVVAPDADADRETAEPDGMTLMSVTPKSAPIAPAATAASDDAAAATDEEMDRQRQRVRVWQMTA